MSLRVVDSYVSEVITQLEEYSVEFTVLDQNVDDQLICEPKFLLFDRADAMVMTISAESIDPLRLQKSNEPATESKLLSSEEVIALGFPDNNVHPFFVDSRNVIARILVDAKLLARLILFPDSKIMVPLYADKDEKKIVLSLQNFFDRILLKVHKEKMLFANVTHSDKPDDQLLKLISKKKTRTRFAPTPSNQLHIGSLRSALIPYLFSLKNEDSEFYLRVDNTDEDRLKPEVLKEILDELQWIGIKWKEKNLFRQTDEDHKKLYLHFLELLTKNGLVEDGPDNTLKLKSVQNPFYCNLWFDWREGIVVDHNPPQTQSKEEKEIFLTRNKPSGSKTIQSFYRFSGIVDDTLFSSFVFRDSRQYFLTQVQNHIRMTAELARQNNADSSVASLKGLGLDLGRSMPLPIYVHLSYLTDEKGLILSKRHGHETHMVHHLRFVEQLSAEGILAYLVSTIIPAKGNDTKAHIAAIAKTIAEKGMDEALKQFAAQFELDDVAESIKPIRCNMKDVFLADRLVLKYMSRSLLKEKLVEAFPDTSFVKDANFLSKVLSFARADEFSGWRQLVSIIKTEENVPNLKESTLKTLERFKGDSAGDVNTILEEIKRLQPDKKGFSALVSDLRMLLTSTKEGAPLETILTALPPNEIAARLQRYT